MIEFRSKVCSVFALGLAIVVGGCSHRPSASKLSFNANSAAQAALTQYDTDHDGALAGSELAACPGIKNSLGNFDKNGDNRVDQDELKNRFQVWLDSPTRFIMLLSSVTLDGQPLEGATVTFTPEPFLADAIFVGEGTTGPNGMAGISSKQADSSAPSPQANGMRLGLYRVSVTHPTRKIPEKYNTATTLGAEVTPGSTSGPVGFALTSR